MLVDAVLQFESQCEDNKFCIAAKLIIHEFCINLVLLNLSGKAILSMASCYVLTRFSFRSLMPLKICNTNYAQSVGVPKQNKLQVKLPFWHYMQCNVMPPRLAYDIRTDISDGYFSSM